ncbi:hypothetical protein K490DRAFT_53530 [Saccharata proteae CBS 121410]|uniref:Uncharacterized protein n=1 Tax=Saccharata proteae CBS 121410 TaxID=1314787 RepID=A0A9P4HZ71_9PEZI|nr:hypothetical protein K490DRAFT_53530 [Saccharata proteae CBS 121410]
MESQGKPQTKEQLRRASRSIDSVISAGSPPPSQRASIQSAPPSHRTPWNEFQEMQRHRNDLFARLIALQRRQNTRTTNDSETNIYNLMMQAYDEAATDTEHELRKANKQGNCDTVLKAKLEAMQNLLWVLIEMCEDKESLLYLE